MSATTDGLRRAYTATNIQGTEFPMTPDGRTYHVTTKKGELSNRILHVGDPERAERIVKNCFDGGKETLKHESTRGFTTYTGTVGGKRISVMAVGMGTPMTDFAVREGQAVADDGPMAIIRLGSCGTPQREITTRTVVVAKESFMVRTNYDAFHDQEVLRAHYDITKAIQPDPHLHARLVERLKQEATFPVKEASDATCEFFYSTQGREDVAFDDHNSHLIDEVLAKRPETGSLQMETFQLFHLGAISAARKINVAACAIVLANRVSGEPFLSNEEKYAIEIAAGRACLQTLVEF